MDFIISIYVKILFGCIVYPIGIFAFLGLGSNRSRNLLVYSASIIASIVVTIVVAYFPIFTVAAFICICLLSIVLLWISLDCIGYKLELVFFDSKAGTTKKGKNYNANIVTKVIFPICVALLMIKLIILAVLSQEKLYSSSLEEHLVFLSFIIMPIILGALLSLNYMLKARLLAIVTVCVYVAFSIITILLQVNYTIGLSNTNILFDIILSVSLGIVCIYFEAKKNRVRSNR